MGNDPSAEIVYETSRYKALVDEYDNLSTNEGYLDWGKKAPAVAA